MIIPLTSENRSPGRPSPFQSTRNNGNTSRILSSKRIFIFVFFGLWIIVSITLFVKYDFYRPSDLADLPKPKSFYKRLSTEIPEIQNVQHDSLLTSHYQQIMIHGQFDAAKLKQESGEEPILLSRTYTRRPENVEWQKREFHTTYPGSSMYQMHGVLKCSKHFSWQDKLQHPLSRNVTDIRPKECKKMNYDLSSLPVTSVVIIFCNENIELLLRSVHSILDRTPPSVLREIILVDDFSDDELIKPKKFGGKGELQEYIAELPKVRYIRLEKRGGIVGARMKGIQEAKGDVFVILDSHVEVVHGWLEPLVKKIQENPRTVVMPVIDGISFPSLEPIPGGIGCVLGIIWSMIEHSYNPDERNPERHAKKQHEFITSPTMAGGLFGANRQFFLDLGGYDLGMGYWGTENVELSFRIWQCGGSLECTECSHVHHLFGGMKRYSSGVDSAIRNKLRTMTVWMDRYADLAWHVLGSPVVDFGDISERQRLRQDLKCRDFQWFLDNVWPESDIRNIPEDVPYMGPLKNIETDICLLGGSLGPCDASDLMYFKRSKQIHMTMNDEMCLTVDDGGNVLKWTWCSSGQKTQQWTVNSPGQIRPVKSKGICIAVRDTTNYRLALEPCKDGDKRQIWTWREYAPPSQWNPPKPPT